MRTRALVSTLGLLVLLGPSCTLRSPAPLHEPVEETGALLPWLETGTSREDVLLQLGTPWCEFEGGRILCYLLEAVHDELRAVEMPSLVSAPRRKSFFPGRGTWDWVDYDLVLVFDRAGRLVRHRLFGTSR